MKIVKVILSPEADSESKVEIIAFILDILDHSKYDKKFGYKKK